jgi:hypothetical protein
MTGKQCVAASKQLLPAFRRGRLKVGPILNGWLLDNQQDTFASFCPDELLGLWDWFGIDTYESGTMEAPGGRKPGDRVPALSAYLRSRGQGRLPIGVGEYNGYSAQSLEAAGRALLRGWELSGDRLAAFRKTLADPRCARTTGS